MWLSRIPGHFYIYCTSHSTAHLHDRLGKHVSFKSFSHDRNGNRNTKQMLRTIFWVYTENETVFEKNKTLCICSSPACSFIQMWSNRPYTAGTIVRQLSEMLIPMQHQWMSHASFGLCEKPALKHLHTTLTVYYQLNTECFTSCL
jgi:hypothetical protein